MKRFPSVAGQFYPGDKNELKKIVERFLSEVKPSDIKGKIKALIVPHAGYEFSGGIAATGYKMIEGKEYKNVIIFGPAHRCQFENMAVGDYGMWETPLGDIATSSVKDELVKNDNFDYVDDAHDMEHSIEVQLPFLQTVLKEGFEITPIATGEIEDHQNIAKVIAKYLDEKTFLIVSSDLSHYQYYEDAEEEDRHTAEEICRLESDISHEEACGADGIKILIEIAKMKGWKPLLLEYKNSGDITSQEDEVVGYASIAFLEE